MYRPATADVTMETGISAGCGVPTLLSAWAGVLQSTLIEEGYPTLAHF